VRHDNYGNYTCAVTRSQSAGNFRTHKSLGSFHRRDWNARKSIPHDVIV
jgi:hypothetical protein